MIAIASDHHGIEMKKNIIEFLAGKDIKVVDCGSHSPQMSEYPIYIQKACLMVARGECERAIVLCGTGIGASIAANKVKGIRCALCSDLMTARLTRMHNDTNVLAMGADIIGVPYALEIVETWLGAEFSGGRHARRVEMITKIENGEVLE
jgi:ribose 5-phosphate isomerase B